MSNIQKSPTRSIADFRFTEAFTKDKDSTLEVSEICKSCKKNVTTT